jgi:nucleoside-diphosphate-sugar epimerase
MNNNVMNDTDSQHVVFGATGAYGYAVIKKLQEKSLNVRAVVRDEGKASGLFPGNVETAVADVMNEEQVSRACKGASVIYMGQNFSYGKWNRRFLRSVYNILKGCRETRPSIVFPGNVYGYGEFQHIPVDESHPLDARSVKGKLRNQIETLLMDYHRRGKLSVVIPRFADFYGPNVVNELYGAMFRSAINGEPAIWPVNADLPHNFTYIDDAAEASVLLVCDPDSYGQVFHVSGEVITPRKFIEEIFNAAGTQSNVRILSRRFLRVAGIFNSNARGLIELLYEYTNPYILDDSKFMGAFPAFKHTSYNAGIKRTVDWFKSNPGAK